ncbi:unnamed protein product [Meloidogyne enterolobii]|uniref:Uncharacterized protein n=1 Tax=Meloidogyne enterolobii TaxID=390850 RepID=A0ACB0Z0J0_MELEN
MDNLNNIPCTNCHGLGHTVNECIWPKNCWKKPAYGINAAALPPKTSTLSNTKEFFGSVTPFAENNNNTVRKRTEKTLFKIATCEVVNIEEMNIQVKPRNFFI